MFEVSSSHKATPGCQPGESLPLASGNRRRLRLTQIFQTELIRKSNAECWVAKLACYRWARQHHQPPNVSNSSRCRVTLSMEGCDEMALKSLLRLFPRHLIKSLHR